LFWTASKTAQLQKPIVLNGIQNRTISKTNCFELHPKPHNFKNPIVLNGIQNPIVGNAALGVPR